MTISVIKAKYSRLELSDVAKYSNGYNANTCDKYNDDFRHILGILTVDKCVDGMLLYNGYSIYLVRPDTDTCIIAYDSKFDDYVANTLNDTSYETSAEIRKATKDLIHYIYDYMI